MWVSGGRSSKLQRSALLPLLINREIELGSGATGAPCRPYDEHGDKISTVYYISQESAKDWQPQAQPLSLLPRRAICRVLVCCD